MCTAATYKTKDFYFGRTLDYEFSYGDEITITPRNYEFKFKETEQIKNHYAIIGMAYVAENYPLYYDAINEKGLGIAGLNFVGNTHYSSKEEGKDNITQYEFIPWILSQCTTVKEARQLVEKMNFLNEPFNEQLPLAQLHWIIADKEEAITVEAMKDGIKIYENPVGILTNNPPFDKQMFALNNYMNLSPKSPENKFAKNINLDRYSRGMGAIGLPGDLSSQSRFIRASFVKMNSVSKDTENESVSQFFHILNSVDQQRGCCEVDDGKYEITIYTSCCNASKGIYYYTTYDNHQITAVDMHKENLDSEELIRYPLIKEEQIKKDEIIIIGQDVNHIKKVLRAKIGDEIQICNNQNGENFLCKIQNIENENITCKIKQKIQKQVESNIEVTIFQGLPKADKMEFIIQKAVELGVYDITPVEMKRCVVKLNEKDKSKKVERWQKISEVAAKQSGRDIIPHINNVINIKNMYELIPKYDIVIVAYENEQNRTLKEQLKQIKEKYKEGKIKIGIVIGPEGGLEENDVEQLENNGAKIVTLGKRILRTETVALNVLSIIMYELEK